MDIGSAVRVISRSISSADRDIVRGISSADRDSSGAAPFWVNK